MAERFLDEEETADHAHPRAGDAAPAATAATSGWSSPAAPARARRCSPSSGRSGSPRRAATCCSSASTGALRDHLRKAEKDSGVDFNTFHGALRRARAAGGGAAVGRLRRRPTPRLTGTRSCPSAGRARSRSSAPQYDALFVDEAQDLSNDWLDALIADARAIPTTRSSGCSWTPTSASTTNRLEVPDGVPAVRPRPSTAATRRRSTAR